MESDDRSGDVTRQLHALSEGDEKAAERLWELVYDDLRAIAGRLARNERANSTLQPTAIVHEAALRLFGEKLPVLENRRHFCAIAATAMRRVLVDQARKRDADKRGGDWRRVTLADGSASASFDVDVLDLHRAMEKLEAVAERQARVVELRYFGGLTLEEVSEQLDISVRTAQDDWANARVWLFRELKGSAKS